MTAAARIEPPPMQLTQQKVSAILLTKESVNQITPMLPVGVSIERVIAEVNRAVLENPEILEATPVSIVLAISQCVKWDLEIGQTVHLVPFNAKVSKRGAPEVWEKRIKALRDYKGMIELVVRAGAARSIDAKNVYKNEHFVYHEGSEPYIEHHPQLDPRSRGPQIGSYAIARMSHYLTKIAWLSVEEIEAVRAKHSKQWKEGALPDWYGPKTCVHRVAKFIPKNPALAAVLAQFEEEDVPEGEFEIVPENGSVPATTPEAPKQESDTAHDVDPVPMFEEESGMNEMTLEEAMAVTLNGLPTSWNGQGGALVSSFKTPHIEKIRTWSIKRIEEKGEDLELEKIATACTLILEARAKDQGKLDLLKPPVSSLTPNEPKSKTEGKKGPLPF